MELLSVAACAVRSTAVPATANKEANSALCTFLDFGSFDFMKFKICIFDAATYTTSLALRYLVALNGGYNRISGKDIFVGTAGLLHPRSRVKPEAHIR